MPLPQILPVQLIGNGFLPTRGSMILDFVFVAMFAICAVMLASIWLVRYRRAYLVHRNIQIGLAIVLAVAIAVFEIDVRFITDWRALAAESRFYESGWVDRSLWVHLLFAIPTPFVWAWVVIQAVRHFDRSDSSSGPNFGDHQRAHKIGGRIAAALMLLTATTGCLFYWLAFAC